MIVTVSLMKSGLIMAAKKGDRWIGYWADVSTKNQVKINFTEEQFRRITENKTDSNPKIIDHFMSQLTKLFDETVSNWELLQD